MMPRTGLLACALLAAMAAAGPQARAESAPPPGAARLAQKAAPLPPSPPAKGLDGAALKAEVAGNREFQERLKAEIEAAKGDRGKLSRLLVDASGRARDIEQRIIDLEGRMARLDQAAKALDISLAQRRGVLAQVLAALLRMGREPPPALVMRPDDALDAVRSAILLGALVPELRVEAETLASDLTELSRVRGELAEARGTLARLGTVLEEDRARLAALIGERQRRQQESDPVPAAERAQAEGVAKASGDVHDLVTRLEAEVPPAARAAEAAQNAAPAPSPNGKRDLGGPDDPARLRPAVVFADAKGLLPLPVAGVRLREFGAPDAAGGAEKGLTIATRSGAPVSAPADGWVVYAGPFRSYGQLLILNAGGGYHILMAGMDRITVDLGQFVLAGEPVAVMGRAGRVGPSAGPSAPSGGSSASGQPQLYVEFRKDGVSIDPAPWWAAATDSRKVRG
ncbi:murein hydrolase activator EnvC family protein [Xanthobacter pseudotagetidis]|uniref:murein hydrolase activator EnvC family protein n=1 Tax=Xanthobacter pseudotagetidis TaxID=3119911 RepID=UPI00372B3CB7